MRVVGAELLDDLAREVGDRFPLSHVVIDDSVSTRIVKGQLPSPTATSFPSGREMADIHASSAAVAPEPLGRRSSTGQPSGSLSP